MTPRLIISDIDGTFITSMGEVTPRLRDVVLRAVDAGAYFGLATGRPHGWLAPVLEQLPIRPLCVCANGAVIYDPERSTVVRAFEFMPEDLAAIVTDIDSALDAHGLVGGYGVERAEELPHGPGHEMFLVTEEYQPDVRDERFGIAPLERLIAQPAVKLVVRCPEMSSEDMFAIVDPVIDADRAHVTYSANNGLLEISVPGVNKSTGVALLAEHYSVDQKDTVAFGDMPNDREMLAWAGYGVAMGNANPVVREVADSMTASNDEDGVAQVLEQWF